MSTARKITVGIGLRVFAQMASILAMFFLVPFTVHTLGDRLYGLWAFVGTLLVYSGVISSAFGAAIIRFLARAVGSGDEHEYRRVFSTAVFVYAAMAAVALLMGLAAAAFAPLFARTAADAVLVRKLFLISAATVALLIFSRVFAGALASELRYDCTAVSELTLNLSRAAAMAVSLVAGYGVVGLAWASLLGLLPYYVLLVSMMRRCVPLARFEFSRADWHTARRLFSYSAFALVAQIAEMLRFQLDVPVVAWVINISAVTHYRVAGTISTYVIEALSGALGTGIFPAVFSTQEGQRDFSAIRKTFLFATKISLIVASFIGFGLIAWGKPFIVRWMGPAYLDAYPALVWLAAGCIVTGFQLPAVSLLFGVSKHRVYAVMNILEGVANVLLSIVLARRFGMVGVAAGTVIPMIAARVLFQPVYVCRVAGIRFAAFARAVLRTAAVAGAAIAASYLATAPLVAATYPSLILTGLVAIVVYLPLPWLLALRQEERGWLVAAIRHRPATRPVSV